MSWFSHAANQIVSHPLASVAAPVLGATQAFTGMSPQQQLMIGAGIGGGLRALGGSVPPVGIPGLQNGAPLVNGGVASGGSSAFDFSNPAMLGLAGSVFGSLESAEAMKAANEQNVNLANEQMNWSAAQAQREMDFQENMSNTSYQRAVADMRAAGVNPMLAIGNGGESTPGGAMGSGSSGKVDAVPSVVSGTLNSALNLISTFANAQSAAASADKARAEIPIIKAHTPEANVSGKLWGYVNSLVDNIVGSYNKFSAKDNQAKSQGRLNSSSDIFDISNHYFGPSINNAVPDTQ